MGIAQALAASWRICRAPWLTASAAGRKPDPGALSWSMTRLAPVSAEGSGRSIERMSFRDVHFFGMCHFSKRLSMRF
jgi:hypothetical protein